MKTDDWDFQPIIVMPCVVEKAYIKFLGPDQEYIIRNNDLNASILREMVNYCNGNLTIKSISDLVFKSGKIKPIWEDGIDVSDSVIRCRTFSIIEDLVEIGAVVDSREQYKHFHKTTIYPTTFLRNLSQDEVLKYHDECKHIKTTRLGETFKVDWDPKSKDLLIDELRCRQSCRKFDPEKGISLSMLRDLCKVSYGYTDQSKTHRVVPSAGDLYPLKLYVISHGNAMRGYYEYDPEENGLIRFAAAVDIEQIKFCFNSEDLMGASAFIVISGNFDRQGYKYANRAYRFCLLEAGHVAQNVTIHANKLGFDTCELGGVLDDALHDELLMDENEMPLLAIAVGQCSSEDNSQQVDFVRFVEENVGQDKPVKNVFTWTDGGGFYTATAEYEDHGEICVGGGTARSDKYAAFKAVIEAYERYVSFGDDSHKRPANSSGIAAHFDYYEAQKSAVAELIERDAIMRCWQSKKSPNHISRGLWSRHLINRLSHYHKDGRKLSVLDISTEYALVVLVAITADKYPYFVCGAACMIDYNDSGIKALHKIMDKALLEAESSLLYYINHPECGHSPKVEDVHRPEDHGKLYRMSKRAADAVGWLTASSVQEIAVPTCPYNGESDRLLRDLSVKTEVLGRLDNGLVVVQASSEKLIPMTFGYDQSSDFPHFFA